MASADEFQPSTTEPVFGSGLIPTKVVPPVDSGEGEEVPALVEPTTVHVNGEQEKAMEVEPTPPPVEPEPIAQPSETTPVKKGRVRQRNSPLLSLSSCPSFRLSRARKATRKSSSPAPRLPNEANVKQQRSPKMPSLLVINRTPRRVRPFSSSPLTPFLLSLSFRQQQC